tara:strand:- start:351 stop:1445 length:1095 start_codon:yes stop_codon:yes gene_type:complete
MATLEVKNICKSFGSTEILKGINLSVKEGEFIVLVGPSGCGKSTLLNIIAGLESTNQGDLLLDGLDIKTIEPKDRDIAMVFQSYALYPNMNVEENITFGLKTRKVPQDRIDQSVEKFSTMLKINHLLDRKPGQLSGGQRQRVAMGRALVRDPKIFLFDEPLSNLDAKLRVEMRSEIKKLHQALKTTIVYVTHDQTEAMSLASKIAVMNDGNIEQFGNPDDLFNRPKNLFVAEFIGTPSMNFFPGMLVKESNGVVFHEEKYNLKFTIGPQDYTISEDFSSKDVILGIRPEYLSLKKQDTPPIKLKPLFKETNGFDQFIFFENKNKGREIVARLLPNDEIILQEETPLYFDIKKISLFDQQTGIRL